jgi:hypothetical protein
MASQQQQPIDSDEEEDNNYDWDETEETLKENSELSYASPIFSPFIRLPSVSDACSVTSFLLLRISLLIYLHFSFLHFIFYPIA